MNAREFLELIKDIAAERDAAVAPHQAWHRDAVLAAEEAFNKRMQGPVKNADKARALGGRNGELLLSYVYKWHEEDCEAELSAAIEKIDKEYNQRYAPIEAEYNRKVAERLACSSTE